MSEAPRPPQAIREGDRVRCVRSPTHRAIHLGAEGTVSYASDVDVYFRVDFDCYDFERDTLVTADDVEVIPPPPEPTAEEREVLRVAARAATEQWHADYVNKGLTLKSLKETWGLQFQFDVVTLPAGQRTELWRHLGALLRPYCPEAADYLESHTEGER